MSQQHPTLTVFKNEDGHILMKLDTLVELPDGHQAHFETYNDQKGMYRVVGRYDTLKRLNNHSQVVFGTYQSEYLMRRVLLTSFGP